MTANLAKFVGDASSLAPPGWQKPQHVLDAIKKRKKKRALFLSKRDCGTGAGGFKPGNKCGGDNKGGGGESGNDEPRWPTASGPLTPEEESAIGDWMNDATTHRELDEQGKASPALLSALAKMPRYEGLAYRGMVLDEDTAKGLLSSKTFDIAGLSSFGNKATASQYADPNETGRGGVGVVIRARLKDARDISEGASQKEYVIRRASFSVVSVVEQPDGPYLVVADQVDPDKKPSRRDCGTGAGGFKPGNKCGGDGDGDGGSGSIPPASDLKMTKRLGGSTGAMLAEDKNGNQFVIKGGNSAAHIASESAANDVYAAAGVPVPAQQLDKLNGKTVQVSEYVPGPTLDQLDGAAFEKAAASLRENFAADALLANWDVIGLAQDNIVVPSDGRPPMRIDNGGSLGFRAQGKPKAFGPEVGEINSMRTSDQGKPIFGKLSDADIAKQIDRLASRRDAILAATPANHRDTMSKRLDYMQAWAKNKRSLELRQALDRRLELRNCGTGAGGFGEGNTCAKGGAADAAATMGSGKKPGAWMEKKGYPSELVKTVAHAKLHGVLLAKAKADGLSSKQAKAVAKQTLKNALNPAMAGGPQGFTALAKQYGIDPNHPDNVLDAKGLKNDPGIYAGEKAMAAGLPKPPAQGANANVSGVNKVMPPPAPPKAPVPPPQAPPPAAPDPKAPAVQPEPTKAGASATPGKPPPGMLPTGAPGGWASYTSDSAPDISELQKSSIKALPVARDAIAHYTASDYAKLNESLRMHASNTGGSLHELGKFDQKTAILVSALDVPTRIHAHDKPFTVYRGAGNTVCAQLDKMAVGQVWQDTGYVSTSTKRQFADTWGGNPAEPGIAMKITTRYGLNVQTMSTHKSENEILLPRRSQFRLKSKEWRYVNNQRRLYVELEHIGWHP